MRKVRVKKNTSNKRAINQALILYLRGATSNFVYNYHENFDDKYNMKSNIKKKNKDTIINNNTI